MPAGEPKGAIAMPEVPIGRLSKLARSDDNRRNDLVDPISMLPEELLVRIIAEAVDTESLESATSALAAPEMDEAAPEMDETEIRWRRRVEVSAVCKTWRTAVLDCPVYWAEVQLHLGCADLMKMLPRWKGYPRRVLVDFDTHPLTSRSNLPTNLPDLLAPNPIADFDVVGSYPDSYAMLWTVLPQGWNSTIHTLHISFYGLEEDMESKPAMIPSHTLLGTNGALRHLTLSSCSVDWEGLDTSGILLDDALSNLRTLEMSHLRRPPPSSVLNRILSSLRYLESLTITDSLPHTFHPAFTLPNPSPLARLDLAGHHEPLSKTLLWMWSKSTFPDLACLRFNATCIRFNMLDPPMPTVSLLGLVTDVLECFMQFVNRSPSLRRKTIVISHHSSHSIVGTLSESLDVPEADELESTKSAEESMLWIDSHPRHYTPRHFSLIESSSFPEAVGLSLEIEPELFVEYHREVFAFLFQRHPDLEVLELTELHKWDFEKMKDFIHLLSPRYHPTLLLPKLRKLRVTQTEFRWENYIMGNLRVMLMSRWRDKKSPIRVVEFQDCNTRRDERELDLSMLREVIPERVTRLVVTNTSDSDSGSPSPDLDEEPYEHDDELHPSLDSSEDDNATDEEQYSYLQWEE